MPRSVTFPRTVPRWLFNQDAVQFFSIVDNKETVMCLISAEALLTHFGAKDMSDRECVRAFNEHRSTIEEVARQKILNSNFERGDVLVLRTADFPQTTTTQPPLLGGIQIVVPKDLDNYPSFQPGITVANAVLAETLATKISTISAVWEMVRLADSSPLATLTIFDSETKSAAYRPFTADELASPDYARFALFRLWDDLLRERGRKQLEALRAEGVE